MLKLGDRVVWNGKQCEVCELGTGGYWVRLRWQSGTRGGKPRNRYADNVPPSACKPVDAALVPPHSSERRSHNPRTPFEPPSSLEAGARRWTELQDVSDAAEKVRGEVESALTRARQSEADWRFVAESNGNDRDALSEECNRLRTNLAERPSRTWQFVAAAVAVLCGGAVCLILQHLGVL